MVGSCLGAVGLRSARDGSLLVIWGDLFTWGKERKTEGEKEGERREVSNKIGGGGKWGMRELASKPVDIHLRMIQDCSAREANKREKSQNQVPSTCSVGAALLSRTEACILI